MSHLPDQDPSPLEFYVTAFLITALVMTWLAAVVSGVFYLVAS